jgi:hypothetical protein
MTPLEKNTALNSELERKTIMRGHASISPEDVPLVFCMTIETNSMKVTKRFVGASCKSALWLSKLCVSCDGQSYVAKEALESLSRILDSERRPYVKKHTFLNCDALSWSPDGSTLGIDELSGGEAGLSSMLPGWVCNGVMKLWARSEACGEISYGEKRPFSGDLTYVGQHS